MVRGRLQGAGATLNGTSRWELKSYLTLPPYNKAKIWVSLDRRQIVLTICSQLTDFQAAQNLTRAYTVLLLFLVGVITFQLFSGESLGIVRRREDQPRAYWTILAVQVASIVLLLFCTTCIRARARVLPQLLVWRFRILEITEIKSSTCSLRLFS